MQFEIKATKKIDLNKTNNGRYKFKNLIIDQKDIDNFEQQV